MFIAKINAGQTICKKEGALVTGIERSAIKQKSV
jgi:hypothetical protein